MFINEIFSRIFSSNTNPIVIIGIIFLVTKFVKSKKNVQGKSIRTKYVAKHKPEPEPKEINLDDDPFAEYDKNVFDEYK